MPFMRKYLPSLNQLKAFEATARHLSFSKAAEELSVTHAAISHQVKGLEEFLQTRLFHRLTRSIRMTHDAVAFYEAAKNALDTINSAAGHFFDKRAKGPLNLSVGPSFATRWLLPKLDDFRALNPEIELNIHPNAAMIDFAGSECDFAIRLGSGSWPGLTSVKLFEEGLVPVASPNYVDSLGNQHFLEGKLLGWLPREFDWKDWVAVYTDTTTTPLSQIVYPVQALALDAAIAGEGVALVNEFLVESDLASGRLVTVHNTLIRTGEAFYLVYPIGTHNEAEIEIFARWICNLLPSS